MTNQQLSDAIRLLELRGIIPPSGVRPVAVVPYSQLYREFTKAYMETPLPFPVKEPNEPK